VCGYLERRELDFTQRAFPLLAIELVEGLLPLAAGAAQLVVPGLVVLLLPLEQLLPGLVGRAGTERALQEVAALFEAVYEVVSAAGVAHSG